MTLWQNQTKIKLTKEMVEQAEPHSIIASGFGYIEHPWFNNAKKKSEGGNLEEDGRSVEVRFVIFRGGIADWCIYHSLDANLERSDFLAGTDHLLVSLQKIADHGAKSHREEIIRALVDCDDETFAMYRH